MTTATPTPVHVAVPEGATVGDLRRALALYEDGAIVRAVDITKTLDHRPVLRYGPLRIDTMAATVTLDDQLVELRNREYSLLVYLASRPGVALSYLDLLDGVWGGPYFQPSVVTEAVRRVRVRIGREWITTVRGFGYRFEGGAR